MNEKKQTIAGLKGMTRAGMAAVSVAAFAAMAAAQMGTPRVLVNGQPVAFAGQPPVQRNGRVLVPLRGVLEKLGAYVEYDSAANQVTAFQGQRHIVLPINSTSATVDGQPVTLDAPAELINGSTMVPLRFVAESLGANVRYDSSSNTVAINGRPGMTSVATNNAMPGGGRGPATGLDTIVGSVIAVFPNSSPQRIVVRPSGAPRSGSGDVSINLSPTAAVTEQRADGTSRDLDFGSVALGDRVRIQQNGRGSARSIDVLRGTPGNGGGGPGRADSNTVHTRFTSYGRLNGGLYEVRTSDGKAYNISDSAPILLNGNRVYMSDLRPGDGITLTIDPNTGRATRVLVDAR